MKFRFVRYGKQVPQVKHFPVDRAPVQAEGGALAIRTGHRCALPEFHDILSPAVYLICWNSWPEGKRMFWNTRIGRLQKLLVALRRNSARRKGILSFLNVSSPIAERSLFAWSLRVLHSRALCSSVWFTRLTCTTRRRSGTPNRSFSPDQILKYEEKVRIHLWYLVYLVGAATRSAISDAWRAMRRRPWRKRVK